jgi:putative flippase GtrA
MFKKLFSRFFNREIIMYLIFGVATTVVNWGVTFLCQRVFGLDEPGIQTSAANGIAWFAAVLFAFITNRSFVFEKTDNSIWAELIKFYAARIFTGLFETFLPDGLFALSKAGGGALSFLSADFLGLTGGIAKAITTVIVIILNYILSKLVVFTKKKKTETEGQAEQASSEQ